eukprot:scaffold42557_cov54-Phaeocystis_antarctica.AAC.3
MCAVPRLPGRSTLAPRPSSTLTISSWSLIVAAYSKKNASTSPPVSSHLTTFCSSPCSADSKISTGSEAGELTAGSPASGEATGVAAAGCGGCCRMSCAVAAWPWASAQCSAVRPPSPSSSVLALARSRACTHASCPWPAANIRAV